MTTSTTPATGDWASAGTGGAGTAGFGRTRALTAAAVLFAPLMAAPAAVASSATTPVAIAAPRNARRLAPAAAWSAAVRPPRPAGSQVRTGATIRSRAKAPTTAPTRLGTIASWPVCGRVAAASPVTRPSAITTLCASPGRRSARAPVAPAKSTITTTIETSRAVLSFVPNREIANSLSHSGVRPMNALPSEVNGLDAGSMTAATRCATPNIAPAASTPAVAAAQAARRRGARRGGTWSVALSVAIVSPWLRRACRCTGSVSTGAGAGVSFGCSRRLADRMVDGHGGPPVRPPLSRAGTFLAWPTSAG